MIHEFIKFNVNIQLYHWHTKLYARHVAAGALYDKMQANTDKLVEVMQSDGKRFQVNETISLKSLNDKDIIAFLKNFIDFLKKFDSPRTDIITIRDDMLIDVNQTLYLFSLE
jgi:hypothetical protein